MRVFGKKWFPGKDCQKSTKTRRLDIFTAQKLGTHFCASQGHLSNPVALAIDGMEKTG